MLNFIKNTLFTLSELETVGICHRDINPENFIVTEDENKYEKIKLINFSTSVFKTIGSDSTLFFPGSHHFFSPEKYETY